MAKQQNRQKASNVKKVNPNKANLKARGTSSTNLRVDNSKNTVLQNEIARVVRRSGNSAGFSGRGINETASPITIYNLEKGLSHADLIKRYETMTGKTLSKSQRRRIGKVRAKALDESHKTSTTNRFGKEIRSVREMKAWQITFSSH